MRRTYRYQFEKPKEENKPSVKETKKRTRISPPRRKIYSFQDLKISDDCGSIDLTKKSIETFVGLPNLEYLIRLNLDSNPLKSFEGSPKLPNLRWLSARNSPISRNPYFKLMAAIVFGNKLATINNEKVMPQIHQQATAFRDSLYPELLKGRIIANLRPLRFIDTKNDVVVNAEPSILAATKKIGYKAPAVQEFERTIVERSKEQFRIPSVATICDGIIEREDEENHNYFPDKFIDNFLSQLHDLRVKYNAKYENSSSEYDDSEEEEAINESTQSQESINDASPIKPPQADNIAKHLIRSESDSEIKMSQLNIEEEEETNDNVSYHSNIQDNLLIDEEEEEEKNEQIESEKKEEEENEKIEKDDLDLKEEEEDESQKIQTLEDHPNEEEEEEENQKIQTLEEHPNEEEEGKSETQNNDDSNENQKESNEEENENEIEKTNNENEDENKDEPSINTNALNEEEEEEKTETQNKNEEEEEKGKDDENQDKSEEEEKGKENEDQSNSEEEDKKIDIQNNSEEEEKNNKSVDDLDQNQDDEEDANLSENSSVKDED